MRYKTFVFAGLLSLFPSSLSASYSPSEWDRYCRKCHIDRPVNSLYDASIKPHSGVSLSCVGCHNDKGVAGHVKKSAESFRLLFQDITLPPDVRSRNTASMTSEDCIRCHPYFRDSDEIQRRKLPKTVQPVSLRAAHGRHWEYRTFTPAQQTRLKALMAEKVKSPLTKEAEDQLNLLSQVGTMHCSRCHERFREDVPGGIAFNVNIAMKNPMECTACHVELRDLVHPGNGSRLPSAVSCERCHTGNLHQKMVFFPVDSGANKDCLRCHPEYSPSELARIDPALFIHKSTAALNQGSARKPMSNWMVIRAFSSLMARPAQTSNSGK
jgi:hypothetical protein